MHWLIFSIISIFAVVLQTQFVKLAALGPQLIMPDLLILTATVLAYRSSTDHVYIACWILGLLKDATCDSPLGVYAVSFGLTAIIIVRIREFFYSDHFLTIMALTFISAFATEQFELLVGIMRGSYADDSYRTLTTVILFSCLYTAALSPYAQWLLLKFQKPLMITPKRKYKLRS